MRVITFGTFDVFHVGHINILERARAMGSELFVGVSSDRFNLEKKGRYPIYCEEDRMRILSALSCVDFTFIEESLEKKAQYIQQYQAGLLVMGDDWQGKFDDMKQFCDVKYLPRTPSVSTTEIIEVVRHTPHK